MPNGSRIGVPVLMVLLVSLPSSAQDFGTNPNPPPAVELTIGHAGFVDDTTIHGTVFGGAMRLYLSPRVSIGPELTYVHDPGGEHSLFLTGNVSIDLLEIARWPSRASGAVRRCRWRFLPSHGSHWSARVLSRRRRGHRRRRRPHLARQAHLCCGGRSDRLGTPYPNHGNDRR